MTQSQLDTILNNISLPTGWDIEVHDKGDGWLVQIVFDATDIHTGQYKEQRCRKWYVSSHAVTSEVVRTVYKAGLAALEHEFDETFRYKDVAIYNPHLNVEDLAQIVDGPERDVREDRRDGTAKGTPQTESK